MLQGNEILERVASWCGKDTMNRTQLDALVWACAMDAEILESIQAEVEKVKRERDDDYAEEAGLNDPEDAE